MTTATDTSPTGPILLHCTALLQDTSTNLRPHVITTICRRASVLSLASYSDNSSFLILVITGMLQVSLLNSASPISQPGPPRYQVIHATLSNRSTMRMRHTQSCAFGSPRSPNSHVIKSLFSSEARTFSGIIFTFAVLGNPGIA